MTLPYSEACYFKYVMSKRSEEYPKRKCEEIKKRSLIITSDDWKVIRENFQSNCALVQCKQLVGKFDQLFLSIDSALSKVPVP